MSDERKAHIKKSEERKETDVQAHAHLKANDEKGSADETDEADVEAHAHLKAHQK